ncbi:MAG: hypothetical protein DRG24_03150 [Epsilonproteobacteria bacterium]|nr:MAG: hypothetical protein DRG24_03150 [Campylobacterota bacterium]
MSTANNEVFEQRLDEAMQKMKTCQQEHKLESCSKCDKFIGCEIRAAYVQSVYDSMSKGETGGFEF